MSSKGQDDNGSVSCDETGSVGDLGSSETRTEPAAMLLSLLLDRALLELVPGCSMEEAVKDVRVVLGDEGSSAALGKKLGELLDSAAWVDESFASDEVLELLVTEFR